MVQVCWAKVADIEEAILLQLPPSLLIVHRVSIRVLAVILGSLVRRLALRLIAPRTPAIACPDVPLLLKVLRSIFLGIVVLY